MKWHTRLLSLAVAAILTHLVTAPKLWALPFSEAKIIIEVNATDGDAGIQIFVDAEGWNRLEVFNPDKEKIFDVTGSGSVGLTGVTELFFESAEPSFEDLPLDQLLARFEAGRYTFSGTTVDEKQLSGKATLKHNIPAGPNLVSPAGEVTLGGPVIVDWDPVTSPLPGTSLPVTIVGYQVIVEREKPLPLMVFSVNLPATVTQVTVPAEFLQAGTEYKFEVLAIETSGNQTISESTFTTTSQQRAGKQKHASEVEARGGSHLRQNHPNPFNPATTFEFALNIQGSVALRVIDVHGRLVRTLLSGHLAAGEHQATWDGMNERGRPAGSGVYFAELTGPGVSESRRIILTR